MIDVFLPLEMIDHIGSFLPLKDLLALCVAHPGMNSLVHHSGSRKLYIDRYTVKVIRKDGTQEWRYNGRLHRENDQPAVVFVLGQHGLLHEWWYNGQRHRENDQPAVVWPNGLHVWYYNGRLHRENDQPAVVRPFGVNAYWRYNKDPRFADVQPVALCLLDLCLYSHCTDEELHLQDGLHYGRAIGSQEWWYHGYRHRDSGNQPAVVWPGGLNEWWHHGERYTDTFKLRLEDYGRFVWHRD